MSPNQTGVAPSNSTPSKLSLLSALPRREGEPDLREGVGLKKARNLERDGEGGDVLKELEEQGEPKSRRTSST